MELATMPHHSSTISATVGTFSPDASGDDGPPSAGAATAAATGSSSRAPGTSSSGGAQQRQHLQSGGTVEAGAVSARVRRHEQPHKSASDSRVAALVADAREGADRSNRDGTDELGDEYEALKYGASHVVHLFVPVSLCMAVVILAVKTVGFFSEKDGHYLPYTPFHSDTEDTGTLLVQSIGNALVMLAFVVIVTVMLVLLYYYRFYKVIYGWLVLSTVGLLTTFSFTFVYEVFKNYNIPLDYLSLIFFLWNWSMVGMVCIHWKGPLMLQQFYLIFVSALMALLFIKYLPDWSVWTVLAMLSIWDLVAVLCPKGPLRILVETTQERNEAILPALVYSSTVLYAYVIYGVVAAATGAGGNDANNGDQLQQPPPLDEEERHSINNNAADRPNLSALDQHQTNAAGGDGSASSTTDAALLLPRSPGRLGVDAVTTSEVAATSSPSSMTMTATTVAAAHQRRGRSTGTSDDSANTLLTTVLTGGSVGEQRTRTVSSSGGHHHHQQQQHRSCTAPRTSRSRSPRHPASEHGVQSAGTGAGATGTVMSEEERGVKLGLGDFIFYSVLVGKASSYGDWNVTIACYVAILVGLAFTLMLLALFHKALPALPISIFSGIIFFFATRLLITPFLDCVSVRQILL
uniref:Presenilin n=1 Tax=Globodera rostochiensis TaxID=31243 RepID=A0A914ICU0_GLORO